VLYASPTTPATVLTDPSVGRNLLGLGAVVVAASPEDVGAQACAHRKPDLAGYAYCMCFATVLMGVLALVQRRDCTRWQSCVTPRLSSRRYCTRRLTR
jgi:hypothetical protein